VIDDRRFSVVRPYLKEWNLLISDVRSSDRGSYRCTVNTNPVRSKITALHVKGRPIHGLDASSQFLSTVCTVAQQWGAGPILSVFFALIVHSKLKSVHPGFPVAFIF